MEVRMKGLGLFRYPANPAPLEALIPGAEVIVTYAVSDPERVRVVEAPDDRSLWVLVEQEYGEDTLAYLAAMEMIVLPEEVIG